MSPLIHLVNIESTSHFLSACLSVKCFKTNILIMSANILSTDMMTRFYVWWAKLLFWSWHVFNMSKTMILIMFAACLSTGLSTDMSTGMQQTQFYLWQKRFLKFLKLAKNEKLIGDASPQNRNSIRPLLVESRGRAWLRVSQSAQQRWDGARQEFGRP